MLIHLPIAFVRTLLLSAALIEWHLQPLQPSAVAVAVMQLCTAGWSQLFCCYLAVATLIFSVHPSCGSKMSSTLASIMPCKKQPFYWASARRSLNVCAAGGWGESNGHGGSGWGDEHAGQGWGDEDAGSHGPGQGALPEQASCPHLLFYTAHQQAPR